MPHRKKPAPSPVNGAAPAALEVTQPDKITLEGLELVELSGKGRALVAMWPFQVGEVVLKELPMLVWREADTPFLPFLKAFLAATPELKATVRNMWYPDLQSTEMLRLRSTAVDLHAQLTAQKLPAGNLSVDEVHQLLAISNMNTHAYVGRPDLNASDHERRAFQRQEHERFKHVSKALTMVVGVFLYLIFSLAPSYETALKIVSAVSCGIIAWFKLVPGAWFKALQWSGAEGTWAAQKEAKTEINRPSLALFAWGSKVNHSCAPNVTFTSRTTDGTLLYTAIQPIETGDEITYSYVDDAYLVPTIQRRRKLQRTKCFTCHCKRCDALDYCRPLPCPTPKCSEYALLRGTDNTDEKNSVNSRRCNNDWVCPKCGPVPPPELALETEGELLRILNELNEQADEEITSLDPRALLDMAKNASEQLCPVHYVAVGYHELTAQVCSSLAAIAMKLKAQGKSPQVYQRFGTAQRLKVSAAEAFLKVAAANICAAANCVGHCAHHRSLDTETSNGGNQGNVRNTNKSYARPPSQGKREQQQHPPLFQASKPAFLAGKCLVNCLMTKDEREHSGLNISKGLISEFPQIKEMAGAVLSLVPAMKIAWGVDDEDVIAVESACVDLANT